MLTVHMFMLYYDTDENIILWKEMYILCRLIISTGDTII